MRSYLLSLALIVSTASASTTFIWSIDNELYYFLRAARELKKEVETETQGRVLIKIATYDASIPKPKTDYAEVEEGKYHISQTVVGDFTRQVPEFKIWNMPFLFKDDAHLENYIQSSVAKNMMSQLETPKVKPIDYTFSGGFLYVFCDKKLNSFSELPSLKIGLAIDSGFSNDFLNPRGIRTFRNMDSQEKAKCGEVLSAGVVDMLGEREAHDYIYNITNHRVIVRILAISKAQINKISPKDQKILLEKLQAYAIRERRYSVEGKDLSLLVLKNRGITINYWGGQTIIAEKKKFQKQYSSYKSQFSSVINFIENLPTDKPKVLVKN